MKKKIPVFNLTVDIHRMRPLMRWFVLFFAFLAGCAAHESDIAASVDDQIPAPAQASVAPQPNVQSDLAEKWGVEIIALRLSAGGYMLDFRYRVIDAEKAAPLFDRKIKPHLIDEATGAKFAVPEPPKVGALRTTRPPQADRNYFIMFANPGRYIKKGNKVTVVIGEFKAENLVVE